MTPHIFGGGWQNFEGTYRHLQPQLWEMGDSTSHEQFSCHVRNLQPSVKVQNMVWVT
jgi:hypothetical protein